MLHTYIEQFLRYCQASNFPPKSVEAFRTRLRQFNEYCGTLASRSLSDISYQHLLSFVADFKSPSVHVKKNRVWALHHFYHFLKLNHLIDENIAAYIPYPKIAKKIPQYLTMTEFNLILRHFAGLTNTPSGLRNLIMIMLLGFLGLRLAALLKPARSRLATQHQNLYSSVVTARSRSPGKITGVIYLNELLEAGVLNLNFQPKHRERE